MKQYELCCDRMRVAVDTNEIPVVYKAMYREFGVCVLDGGTSTIELVFCPWCGQKLPTSLRDRWFDELERLGIDPATGELPAEFTDDRWYRTGMNRAD